MNDLPAEVRALLTDGFSQMQYFISPYGASQLINMMRSNGINYITTSVNLFVLADAPMVDNLPRSSGPPNTCCAGSSFDCIASPAPPVTNNSGSGNGVVCAPGGRQSVYSSCGKLGKVYRVYRQNVLQVP